MDTHTLRFTFPRIYLTGFMASGKSTLGVRLAGRLGYTFQDLDRAIVDRIGMPIADYFRARGEAAFREVEAAALRNTASDEALVVAVGGGALASADNLAFALANGLVVYLEVGQDELVRRLRSEPNTRPMLLDVDGLLLSERGVQERIARLLAAREPYYRRAHLVVDVGRPGIEEAVERLYRAIADYAPGEVDRTRRNERR
jgi:shikimate kinase